AHRDLPPAPGAGHDRAAVQQDRRPVDADHRHRRCWDRLVTRAEADERVEHVTTSYELDRVRDDLAADERCLHPLAAHGYAIRDGDRVELHRVGAGTSNARLQWNRQLAEPKVAGHGFGPAVGDADKWFLDVLGAQADRAKKGASTGPDSPLGQRSSGPILLGNA